MCFLVFLTQTLNSEADIKNGYIVRARGEKLLGVVDGEGENVASSFGVVEGF